MAAITIGNVTCTLQGESAKADAYQPAKSPLAMKKHGLFANSNGSASVGSTILCERRTQQDSQMSCQSHSVLTFTVVSEALHPFHL
jgi:hypothetical protein